MIFRHLLSTVPFVLLNLMAPDTGGATAGSSTATVDDPIAPEPEGNTLEEKLTSAKSIIGTLFAKVASIVGLTKERDDAKAESTRLQQQFDEAKTGWENEKTAHATTKASLTTVTSERDTEKAGRATAETNVSRLESLCQLKGIDPKAAVASQTPGSKNGKELYDQWQELKKDPAKSKAATKFSRTHKDALADYAESLRS